MHLYHPDMPHDSRRAPAEVSASDQVRSKPTYLSGLGATDLLLRPSSFLLFWLSWRWSWRWHKRKDLSCIQKGFHPHRHQGVLNIDILHASTSGWSARRSTTWIIRTPVGTSTVLHTYVWKKRRSTSQWRRRFNEKADCVSWFKKLI